MNRLIITRGLPGSGKTTRARAWVAEDPAGRVRVNRDDLRAMAHDSVYLGHATERHIQALRDRAIATALKRGLDVICDDTNLPSRTVRDLRRLARGAGAEFEVWDLSDVPVDVCVARDAARSRVVGEKVIRDMYTRFVAGRPHPLPLADEPEEAATAAVPYVPVPGTPRAIMVDIDGTVALMNGRSPYDESRVAEDLPNLPVIATVRALSAAGNAVVFCSGRTEGCRDETRAWLRRHVGTSGAALHMRKAGDVRKDSVVKAEIFDRGIREAWDVLLVLDDRQQVVDMWRELGLTVLQVAPGAF